MYQPRPQRTNLFRHIRPLMLVSIIWGLVPRVAAASLPKRLLAFAYFAAVSVFYAHTLYAFNAGAFRRIDKAAANEKLLAKIIYVETTLRCGLLCAVLVVNAVKSGDFVRILEKLADFDELLARKLRVNAATKRSNIRLQLVYAVYVVFFGCYYGSQLYAAENGIVLSVQWAALSNVTLIILSQFTVFVHAFNVHFKTFNTFFADMSVLASLAPHLPVARGDLHCLLSSYSMPFHSGGGGGGGGSNNNYITNTIERKTSKAFLNGTTSYRRHYQRSNAIGYRAFNNVLSQFKLKELHIIYLSMRDLLREINAYYSFQVLLIVCETIAILIAGISTVTFNITGDDFGSKTFDRQLTPLHCGFRLLGITLLIYVAERTSYEANSTVIIIHNFLKTEQNDEVKKALELFLLDLWHHKVKFNAHEFFDLDYQLIQSILSAATTYVIVLVQFQLATAYAP